MALYYQSIKFDTVETTMKSTRLDRWVLILCTVTALYFVSTTDRNAIGQVVEADKPPDGIYAVLKTAENRSDIKTPDQHRRIAKYPRLARWGDTDPSIRFLLLKTVPDVPLRLAADSVTVEDGADGERLNVRLVDESVDRLSRFTAKHIGDKAALILDGQVVMVATVRSVITGGEMQISFCSEGNAEQLADKLRQRSSLSTILPTAPQNKR